MQSLGFPPSSSKIKRSNNSWQRKLFWFYFFHDLLKFCPFLNHEEQNVGFFSKEKCVYIWKYALGCIINKACEQQESEIQKLIFLQCQYHWEAGGVTPHPEVFSLRTRKGGCWAWRMSQALWAAQWGDVQQHRLCLLQPRGCLGTLRTLLNSETAQAQPPQGSVHGPSNESGYQWHPQGHCGCAPACLQAEFVPLLGKKRGNILLVFKGVSCTLISTRLMGLWSSRWGHGVLSDVERGELRHCKAPVVLPVCSLALWRS